MNDLFKPLTQFDFLNTNSQGIRNALFLAYYLRGVAHDEAEGIPHPHKYPLFVIYGPRGSGKTRLIQSVLDSALHDVKTYRSPVISARELDHAAAIRAPVAIFDGVTIQRMQQSLHTALWAWMQCDRWDYRPFRSNATRNVPTARLTILSGTEMNLPSEILQFAFQIELAPKKPQPPHYPLSS